MVLKGKAWKFGDNISTDLIIPGRYFHLRSNLPELAKHTLEDADPQFREKFNPGDFVVAGYNFGLGSSREHAALVLRETKVAAVLAKSFARIFFRNAINVGLPLVECDTDAINEGDELEVDLAKGIVRNLTRGVELKSNPLPPVMLKILSDGGLLPHLVKHGDFALD